jgi:hypothetical protein
MNEQEDYKAPITYHPSGIYNPSGIYDPSGIYNPLLLESS